MIRSNINKEMYIYLLPANNIIKLWILLDSNVVKNTRFTLLLLLILFDHIFSKCTPNELNSFVLVKTLAYIVRKMDLILRSIAAEATNAIILKLRNLPHQ